MTLTGKDPYDASDGRGGTSSDSELPLITSGEELDLGARPPDAEPTRLPENMPAEVATLLQTLAGHEREIFGSELRVMYDTFGRMLEDKLTDLHSPVRVAAWTVVAVVLLELVLIALALLVVVIVRHLP